MKRKFVILNNGLKDHRGHYFETSVSLAEAARQHGWAPVLATHATCRMEMLPDWLPTFPLFTTDHWMAEPPVAAPDLNGAVLDPYDREHVEFAAVCDGRVPIAQWIAGRFQLPRDEQADAAAVEIALQEQLPIQAWRRRAIVCVKGGLATLQRMIRWGWRLAWCGERIQFYLAPPFLDLTLRRWGNALRTPCLLTLPRILQPRFHPRLEERLIEVLMRSGRRSLAAQAAEGGCDDDFSTHEATRRWMVLARQRLSELGAAHEFRHARLFLRDLERLVAMADIGPQDHILLGTTHVRELLAVGWLVSRLSEARSPSFHLEFRHPLFSGDPSEAEIQNSASLRLQRRFFELHQPLGSSRKIQLYTDTDELRQEYELLAQLKFSVLPIPFRAGLIAPRAKAQSATLTLVFLGDARDEKGFPWLPDLIERMSADYLQSGRVRLLLQATLGTPAYNPLSGPALVRLRQFPASQVELVGLDGPLSPEKYYELVSQADLVLLPYERSRYRAASSGTLAEAIAAGRPAVVPANSWMSSQLAPGAGETFHDFESFVTAVCQVVDQYPKYRGAAESQRREWLKRHSPSALVAAICAGQEDASLTGTRAA